MADWGALHEGVVALIARRLQVIEDFIAFRSTCSSWRKATTLHDFHTTSSSSCPKLPLLMLQHFESNLFLVDLENDQLGGENDPEANDEMDENDLEAHDEIDENDSEGNHENNEIDDENDPEANDEMDANDSEGNHENNEIDNENDPEANDENDPEGNHENNEIDVVHREDPKANQNNERELEDVQREDPKASHVINDEMDKMDEIEMEENVPEGNHENTNKIDEIVQTKDLDDDGHKRVRLIRRDGPEANHERKFLSLSKGKTSEISFPEAKGMKYRGSKGWLFMVELSTDNLCLFHPISRVRIPLPKVPTQIDSEGFKIHPHDLRSVALSASPSETSDYVVMVVFFETRYISPQSFQSRTYTGFWKPGKLTWTKVDIPYVDDLIYYNGKFYALTKYAEVWMCDASGPNPTASKIVELPWNWSRPHAQLVECGGRLLTVAPYFCYHYDMEFLDDLEMVEIDVIKGSYNIITCLGSSAVFLGNNEGFSIDTNEFPGIIEPNSIYFGDGSYQVAIPRPNHESEPNYGSGIWFNF